MRSSLVFFVTLFGLHIQGNYGQHTRENGAYVGNLKTIQHDVSGKVWAVDQNTLYIEDFTYDGKGPDAFFWAGNTTQPSPNGVLIKYPLRAGKPKDLPQFNHESVLLQLPPGMTVKDIRWLSVWCRRFTVNFGYVTFPDSIVPPKKLVLPELSRLAHRVRSGNVTILDSKSFYIPNLHYDGAGPDAYFWVGKGNRPSQIGRRIPDERGSSEVLRGYEGEDIVIQLPDNLTVYDIDYLSIWCITYRHNFGHVLIPDDLWVPPALGQTRIKQDSEDSTTKPAYLPDPGSKPSYLPDSGSSPDSEYPPIVFELPDNSVDGSQPEYEVAKQNDVGAGMMVAGNAFVASILFTMAMLL